MRVQHLDLLACPTCTGSLTVHNGPPDAGAILDEGQLTCKHCDRVYPVTQGIPRFVDTEDYAASFGDQWNRYRKTQYDSHSGQPITADRFFKSTGWPRHLSGEVILEAGCGAGRFTEVAAETGATIVSFDLSRAVDANQAANGLRENVLIVQASLYDIPCPKARFDKVFCFGVLQHTPAPDEAFLTLPHYLKPNGSIAVDFYRRKRGIPNMKYWIRPLTRRLPLPWAYLLCRLYVGALFPTVGLVNRLLRTNLSWTLAMADYRGALPLTPSQQKEWALLDTFDMWTPAYDSPRTREEVRALFAQAGLSQCVVEYGANGIVGRGVRPPPDSPNP